ncbi:N2227-domain-containing protein [Obba rivulosa]|uniref:N2227-domain-containing protein n=1 Tax=Obba rivulosa TaxID=1052685 RepID=A0A8E2DL02_9APHY|nr:N2227-domain-containing protein [Obba rivulosa]
MSNSELQHLLASDKFLALLLPITLLVLGFYFVYDYTLEDWRKLFRDILYGPNTTPGPFSVERAVTAYEHYARLSEHEVLRMRSAYSRLGRAHKRIGYDLGYTKKLRQLEESIRTNETVTQAIAELARDVLKIELRDVRHMAPQTDSGDLSRVRESLKHFVRDWSDEGKEEREVIFGPILEVLKCVHSTERETTRVLVPGCGLGRLAWEISELGFDTTANELSSFMNLAFRFLLSELTTHTPYQHVIQPYSSWFSHQRTNASLFRTVPFPDVVPRCSDSLHLLPGDFLTLPSPPPSQSGDSPGYDFIVTLFFLDTSLNAIATLERIYALLRPGGAWINLGPLLWTGGAQAALELSLEEVLNLAEMAGFHFESQAQPGVDEERGKTVECEYTRDRMAMMRWIYKAEFWVARKTER